MTAFVQDGMRPYLDWQFEYPPLAIVPIALGGAFGNDEVTYPVVFGLLMLACLLALQRWVGELGGRAAAWACVPAPLLLGAMIRTHYDLFPAAIVAGALLLFARGRTTWAFAALGVGTVAKLTPIMLVPIAVLWLVGRGERDRVLPGLAAFTAVVVVVCLPFLGDGFLEQFRFHLERPVQIESTAATVLSILGDSYVTGTEATPDRFKSNGLAGGYADGVQGLFTAALALTYLALLVLSARGGDVRRLTLLGLATTVAFMALGKVLSPQYLIWLLPFAALCWAWGDRAIALLCAAAALVTQLEFPSRYFDVVEQQTFAVALVGVRNALLLVLLGVTVARLAAPARSPRPAAVPSSG